MEQYILALFIALLSTPIKYLTKYGVTLQPKKIRNYLLVVFPLFCVLLVLMYFIAESTYSNYISIVTSDVSVVEALVNYGLFLPRVASLSGLFLIYYMAIKSKGFTDLIGSDFMILGIITLIFFFVFVMVQALAGEVVNGMVNDSFNYGVLMLLPFIISFLLLITYLISQLLTRGLDALGNKANGSKRKYEEVKR